MHKFLMFATGLLTGTLTGGILALLLAPQPGPDLQEDIRKQIEHLLEEGKLAAETRRHELETQLETFKQGHPITLQAGVSEEEV